jgi:hypothetical protein
VWTLATFIFVQAYTSTLFTYVVTPVQQPLISSVYELAENSAIQLFLRKAGIPDVVISARSTIFYASSDNNFFHLKFAGEKQYGPQPETTRKAQL